ncbi:GLEYA domain-containing protein [Dactylonectria macrodidyma]|uniref:GLEYA domain-containing protein n=1 Tax=Dactylonectria macrodidyma TaxID=307937 RepID=A0A9P9DML9_9HYPO|nr:GLEYA domain-containing protein [Dactylonectria macrodidyma]
MRLQLAPVVLLPAAASALVVSDKLFCGINSLIIKQLKATAAATSYCSSYLSISTQTKTTTVTITPTPVTDTASITLTVDPITSVETAIQHTTITETTVETTTEIATATSTTTTSTSTITCLNSAYYAPTGAASVAKRGSSGSNNDKVVSAIFPALWVKAQISQACSCLSIATPTTTLTKLQTLAPETVTTTFTGYFTPVVDITTTTIATSTDTTTLIETTTSTTTETAYAVATTIASNGIAYRKYTHSYNADTEGNGFTSSYFKGLTAELSGTIQSLDFSTPNWPSGSETLTLSDGNSFASGYSALLFNGFFIAKESGTYTISTSSDYIDNWGYLWTGDNAYSAWSDSNTNYQASRTEAGYIGGSTTLTLNKGDAIPLTWLWANGGGVGRSHFQIKTPGGSTLTSTSGYFVKACDSGIFA